MKILISSLLFATILISHAEELGLRTWTSSDGKKIQARMLGVRDDKVYLELDNKKETSAPLDRFSKEDQEFVKEKGWPLPEEWKGWPTDLQVTLAKIRIEDLGQKEQWFTYQSEHFEIGAEAELGTACIQQICRLLEGVYLLMEESPWGILASPEGGRFRIELYQDQNSYLKNGGPSDSAGVYLVDRAVFMVPFPSLGIVKSSSGWRQDSSGDYKTLVHELTHMLMADALPVLPPWLVEGAAEYMELIPLRTSVFRPSSLAREIVKHNGYMIAKIRGGRPAPLAQVFDLNLYEWQSGGNSRQPPQTEEKRGLIPMRERVIPFANPVTGFYHSGLLLTYYFIHLDGKGDAARLQRFISAAQQNSKVHAQFEKDYQDYKQAWEDFAALPDVEEVSPNQYRFPSNLTPPTAPVYPFGNPEDEDIRFASLEVLLDGRSKEAVLKDALSKLHEMKIEVSQ